MIQRAARTEHRASQPVPVHRLRRSAPDGTLDAGPGIARTPLPEPGALRASAPVVAVQPAAPVQPPATARGPIASAPAAQATAGRPAPTRNAVLAAFNAASPAPASAAAAAVAAPAPLALAPMSQFSAAPLARLRTGEDLAPVEQRASPPQAQAPPPDLDALADYVLERLRGELRDGRERLGFLLDDSH